MIKRVLIANRGAIAVRILRTLKARGLEGIAVYAEADYGSAHVDLADRAVSLGDGPLAETYLNGDALLAIALREKVDAIHPGYGFLSENSAFAKAVEAAGLIFLGPTAAQINAFGLKHEARALAEEAGVPLLPGSGVLESLEDALRFAGETGYPVILKSSAGGGGIGMQRCEDETALARAFASVAQQAQTNFGDARLFVERFVDAARHVEVQILGNGQGDVVVLGDRDCSLQRRNQKIIEEAPAPKLPETVREAMHEAAARLMASVNYRSAGTVEFLYDPAREAVYFLEVNARLQVEHGVTEMVTGLDIVDWMLRIGDGEGALPEAPTPRGAALQARLYAEDPERAFRPAPGLLTHLRLPESQDRTTLRVDSWVSPGLAVPAAYDPMLAKILVWAPTRDAAIPALGEALRNCEVSGIPTNLPFLHETLGLESFQRVTHHTKTADGVTLPGLSLEVLSPGTQTTIQDVRGRLGYWHVGVPPSGAFDSRALAYANRCRGNDENLPGLEMVVEGPTLKFAAERRMALSGAALTAQLDGQPVPLNQAVTVEAGQTLSLKGIGAQGDGLRAYLAVEGGFAITPVLGSTATFELGGFGGHGGRALRTGDVLPLAPRPKPTQELNLPLPPSLADRTTILGVSSTELDDEAFRQMAWEALEEAGFEDVDAHAWCEHRIFFE
ncbi:MAG: biotin carboxylase N-terminal domain-containing protein, partial [Pseudomonadales bacterium]